MYVKDAVIGGFLEMKKLLEFVLNVKVRIGIDRVDKQNIWRRKNDKDYGDYLPNAKASCSECPSSYELVPPPDPNYKVPREKPTSDDYIKRIYECENGHLNTIYWEKEWFGMASTKYRSDAMRDE